MISLLQPLTCYVTRYIHIAKIYTVFEELFRLLYYVLQIVSVAVVIYNNISALLPTRMNVESFYDVDATTSADDRENGVDPEKIAKATVNSRIVSITVDPPLTPPLEECIRLTMEHTERNRGLSIDVYLCTIISFIVVW